VNGIRGDGDSWEDLSTFVDTLRSFGPTGEANGEAAEGSEETPEDEIVAPEEVAEIKRQADDDASIETD